MLKIVFMRHSEPDYSFAEERKYIGHGKHFYHEVNLIDKFLVK